MKTILLTGFEAFGGEKINPSLEIAKALDERETETYKIVSFELPCVFGEAIDQLRLALQEVKPDIVICVGQAGGRSDLSIERIAINIDDAGIPDNKGNQPIDEPIIKEGPAAFWSSLPIKAIVKHLRDAGLPASVSQTAGTYVCNHVFYGLMHEIRKSSIRGGFIHIPFLPEQIQTRPLMASLPLNEMIRGIEIAIQVSVGYEQDLLLEGGQTH
ncbi:pyroglutamyl-peptidase I [Thermoactinomyces sp. DSM 45892]|uniref:pyroglutamyl-peptidase I n=1 Tax=Thermoactinomyces sp. DSM 45892 TaxID=1882753 RepID=UPI00089BF339|nr:pyroglutamyl-peptidase I [Thermoactinomyces sp. DSM 45892]SDY58878.1 pyroglutamyl-peptidase I Cysteine peptidase. MEROPS family C15 [Thermoactinomyces sp. DSM 45892]